MAATLAFRRPAPVSTARSDLATAIAARDAGARRLTLLRSAVERGYGSVTAAETAVTAAAEAMEAARVADARGAVERMMGTDAPPPAALPAARRAHQDALDALDATTSARAVLLADVAALEAEEPKHAHRVELAVQAVLAEELAASARVLLTEMAALHRTAVDQFHALEFLVSSGAVIETGADALPGVIEMRNRAVLPALSWAVARAADASPRRSAWEAARAALAKDAGAELPR